MEYKVLKFEDIDYVLRIPNGYKEDRKYPILIYLHGAGTRGRCIDTLLNNPMLKHAEKVEDTEFIIAAPQCYANTWFDIFESLKRFAVMIAGESFSDASRIYLTGASMGGYGTWQLAMSMPELFAAIVPVCGGGMYWNAGRLINVPVWAFHGAKDECVYPEESQKMVDSVNRHGGMARLTVYPENGHDAWNDTYSNKQVYEWLLSHSRRELNYCRREKPFSV